jgi:uncharacterized protein YeaO (DUF488 family)
MSTQHAVRVRRVYEEPNPADGVRILVDRLWPRGVRKQDLAHDAWLKDVAPSGDLRTWYGHRPERFEGFARRYRKELGSGSRADALEQLRQKAGSQTVTLLTATRDVERSGAAVLAETLREVGRTGRGRTR